MDTDKEVIQRLTNLKDSNGLLVYTEDILIHLGNSCVITLKYDEARNMVQLTSIYTESEEFDFAQFKTAEDLILFISNCIIVEPSGTNYDRYFADLGTRSQIVEAMQEDAYFDVIKNKYQKCWWSYVDGPWVSSYLFPQWLDGPVGSTCEVYYKL